MALRPTLKIAAAAVAALLVAASMVLAAGSSTPKTMKLACAKKGSGELQYVKRAGDCPASRGKLVRFPDDAPVHACRKTSDGSLFRVSGAAACRPPKHPRTAAVVLPDTSDLKLCAARGDGAVRVVSAFSRCGRGEAHVVLKGMRAPHAADDSATTGEETARTIAVLANDTGVRPLHVASLDRSATKGTVARVAGGGVRYSPNGKFNSLRVGQTGHDSFRYRAGDGVHDSNAATVRVTVTGANDPPQATADTASTDKDSSTAVAVLSNDTDPDGEALSVGSLDATGTKGSVTKDPGGTVTYDPNGQFDSLAPGDTAHDTFAYRASDGHAESGPVTVDVTIGGVNHAPTVHASAGSTGYLEGDPATVVDPGVTVADDDDASLASATAAITGGFGAGDQLEFSSQNGISGSYDAGTGVLTLTGTASKADYQTALRSVRFRSTSDDPAASKTVSFSASDGDLASAPAAKTLTVTPVNDAPSVATTGSSLAYPEGSGAVAVDTGVTVSDADSTNLSGATVRISSSFQASADELAFTNANGISGSYDDSTGTLTLTGSASPAAYQAALRSVTYENSSDDPGPSRTVSFRVTDSSSSQSNTAARTITFDALNDPPVVTTSAGSTPYTEGAAATVVDPALTVADPDNANLTAARATIVGRQPGDELQFTSANGISGAYNSGTGVLTLTGTASKADYQTALRSVKFRTTNDDPAPTRSVEFRVNDGDLVSDPASKTVAVSGVNDPPTVATTAGALGYLEDSGTVVIDPGVAVGDPDSASMSGAKVSISSGFVAADDELVFADQNGIAGSYDDTTGVLTLSGAATRAQYETALRSVKYSNANQDPSGSRTVTFQVTDDGALPSAGATRQIALSAVNDAPTVATSGGSTAYTEGDAATAVDGSLTVSDPDDTGLEGATVRISSGLRTGDVLAVADQNGITGSYDSSTGTLTLSGTASKANYQTALRSVTYRSTSDDPGTTRTVEFSATDGSASSTASPKSIAITPVNDAPALTTSSGALSYQEADGPKAIDPGIVLADPDSANMTGATVTISSGFVAAEDELAFSSQNGISGGYDDTTGTLTLSGTATRAQYETALRSVTYENVSDDPTASRTVTFQVTDDASAASNAATRDIALNGVSDLPVVTTSGGSTSYTEGDPATEVDTGLTVSDTDDANLDSAKVRIASGLQTGDELSLATQNGISGSYDSSTGVLTVSGSASKAAYQTALRSVKFRTTSDAPSASRTVEFTVNDGDADSAPAGKGISITPVNDAPTVTTTAGPLSYTEGTGAVAIDPTLTVTDPDSANLSGATVQITGNFSSADDELAFTNTANITGVYDDTTGTLTLSGTDTVANYQSALRSVTYQNTSDDPAGSRTLSFQATDSSAAAGNTATRGIALTGVNDAPVVTTTSGSTAVTEDAAAVAVDSGLAVSDADDTTLERATVRVSAGLQSGDVLAVADQNGITGTYESATGTLTLSGSSSVANYQAALRSVTFRTTNDNPGATRTIEFKANDGDADSGPATKGLTVTGANDAPTVTTTATALSYTEGDGPVAVDDGLTIADPDSADMSGAVVQIGTGFTTGEDDLAFSDQNGITGSYDGLTGTLTLSGTATRQQYQDALRSVTYSNPSESPATATRTVSFTVTDSSAATSAAATRGITVSPVNDAPVVTPSNGSTAYTEGDPDTVVDGSVTVQDADDTTLEGGTVSITSGHQAADVLSLVTQNGISGSYDSGTGVLTLSGSSSIANYQTALRSVKFRHTGDAPVASKTVAFKVGDGDADSNAPTKEIAITPVNDAPAVTMTVADLSYAENDGPKAIDTGLGLADPDSAQLSGAKVSISANFSAAQDELAFTNTANITGVYDDTTGTLTLSGTDTVADYQAALRSVTYENVSDAPSPATRTISVTATDSDGATSTPATRGIAIGASNDAPTAVDDTRTTDEDTPINEAAPGVLGNDTDPDGVPPDSRTVTKLNGSSTLTGTSAKGAGVTLHANGSFDYDPTGVAAFQALGVGDQDSDSFTYTMEDGSGAASSATVHITVNGTTDAPVATDDTFNVNGNTVLFAGTVRPAGEAGRQITASVLDNDSDADTPASGLSVTPVVDASTFLGGLVTMNSNGTFTYTPPTGTEGMSDSFTYTVSDGSNSDTGAVTIPLAERAWYVDNSADPGGTGRSNDPFDTLAEAESASNSNDTTYVFDGDGTTLGYDTGYAMASGERLIGQASDLTMDPDGAGPLGEETYFSGDSTKRPTLTASNEDVVVLASGATVRGVGVDPSGTGGGIFGSSGIDSGTIDNVDVTDTGTAGDFAGLELLNTTGTFDVSDLTVAMNTSPGVRLSSAGTVNFLPTGTIAISTNDGKALDAISTDMGTGSEFDRLTTTASTSGGVSLINTTGTTSLGDGSGTDLSLVTSASTQAALFLANAGPVTVPAAGTSNITADGGPAVDANGTLANLALDSASSTGSGTSGINVAGLGTGTFSAPAGSITGAAGAAFRVDRGSGDVSYGGTLGDGAGSTASISGRTGGTVTLSGAIADGADAGGGIAISANTGGATVFSNASKVLRTGTGDAVVMSTNGDHSVTFSGGGLDIDTTSGRGFEATAGSPDFTGGTIAVTGSGNTIDTTTGRALNVDDTDIGAAGLNFREIGAGTAGGGPVNGIRLNATGSSGGLTVAGDGTAGSGGTIQKTTGDGVFLASTKSPSLSWMTIDDAGDNGISADDVSGLSINDSKLHRNGAQAEGPGVNGGPAVNDAGIHIEDLTGTGNEINRTDVLDSHNSNLDWDPNASAAQSRLTASDSKFNSAGESVGTGDAGISIAATGTANVALLMVDGEASSNAGDGVRASGDSGTETRVQVSGGAQVSGNGDTGIALTASGSGAARYFLNGLDLQGNASRAISLQSSGSPSVDATVTANGIGTSGVAGSGSGTGEGVFADFDDETDAAVDVSQNIVKETAGAGIRIATADPGGVAAANVDATVRSNTVGAPAATDAHGIDVTAGGDNVLCLDTAGNAAEGAGATEHLSEDLHVQQSGSSTFNLERFTGDGTDDLAVESFLLDENPGSATADAQHTTGFTGVDDGTCQSPALP